MPSRTSMRFAWPSQSTQTMVSAGSFIELADTLRETRRKDHFAAEAIFDREPGFERLPEPVVHALAVTDDARPRERRDLLGQLDRSIKRGAIGNDTVDETHRQGFVGCDLATSQDHVEGAAQPHDAGQALRATVDQR